MAVAATRTAALLLVTAVLLGALVIMAKPAAATTAAPRAEELALRLINNEREARGLRPLAQNLQMVRHARYWATSMAASNRVAHRLDLAAVVDGNFDRLGENVGFSKLEGASTATLVRMVHRSFMRSDGHRAHVLGDYNMVGVGVRRARGDELWITVDFLKGPRDGFPLYRDIDGTSFEGSVKRLFVPGVLAGCEMHRFCPGRSVIRAEFSRTLQSATGSRAAASYMASSCSTSSCAAEPVTRAEAAHMIAAALDLPSAHGNIFTDVAAADRDAVSAVVDAGLMSGCSLSRFCPDGDIPRAQLAQIVDRATR